jgi:hypothetical protein
MRIISQLFPSGKPVSTDIETNRQPGTKMWEIPTWGRPLALGIYPFFIIRDRDVTPAGTAFCVSKLAISMTSLRNIRNFVRNHWHSNSPSQANDLHSFFATKDFEMAVFHHRVLPGRALSGNILDLKFITGAEPTDVGYILPQFQNVFPYLPLPISFALPRIGSRVICAGFGELSSQDSPFTVDDIRHGRINLLDAYEHKFLAVEGHITRIFTQRFKDVVGGPCCTINAEIKPGMCGGPVFSDGGYVVGIVSGGATDFFEQPTSIVSLLYPLLAMNIRFARQIGPIRIDSDSRLIELIAQGTVTTDGSEKLISIHRDDRETVLNPVIHSEDTDYIYNDFSDLKRERHTVRESFTVPRG